MIFKKRAPKIPQSEIYREEVIDLARLWGITVLERESNDGIIQIRLEYHDQGKVINTSVEDSDPTWAWIMAAGRADSIVARIKEMDRTFSDWRPVV